MVIAEFPLVVNPLSLLLSNKPFIRNYRWLPERGLRFHVFEKDGGRHVATAETDAAFAFHHVSAYETGDELIVNLVAYPNAEIIDEFYLAKLRAAAPVTAPGG
jgi:beta,beta-carotene 9',10'-dioxygenase